MSPVRGIQSPTLAGRSVAYLWTGSSVANGSRDVARAVRLSTSYGASMHLSEDEFVAVAESALDLIPEKLRAAIDNVAIVLEEEPPADRPNILGLYTGVPLTERSHSWDSGAIPDTIAIYRGPLSRMCHSAEQLKKEIAVTVIHEVAHHFGIDDDRLDELGWG